MKYSFMTFSCPELTFDEVLALAGRLGYDGVEPRMDSEHRHAVEVAADAGMRAEFKKKADDAEIALCCLATSCTYADPAAKTKVIDDTLARIDLAADIGAPRMRVFGGNLAEGLARDDAIDLLAESFAAVAEHAQSRGVVICVETHDDWCDPAHLAAVMRKVNHPAVAVNWDIMHPVRSAGKTMDEAHETLAPWVKHVHFHDGKKVGDNLELVPIGQGIIDHRRAVELLREADYADYLSGEWIGWEPHETHLPRELALIKSYE